MNFLTAYVTDIGIKKTTNQDAISIRQASTDKGNVLMAVICDGMGGLKKGEVASKEVIQCFEKWFAEDFPELLYEKFSYENLKMQWESIVRAENEKIKAYGKREGISLGTTLSALLVIEDKYYIVHVGDSRVYEFSDAMYMLTEDQTVVAKEIAAGRLTEEQAEQDPRRSILLQCIGASEVVEPAFYYGKTKEQAVYMLCSDGLRHMCSPKELWDVFNYEKIGKETQMKDHVSEMVELVKQRKETDNISCILIKTKS